MKLAVAFLLGMVAMVAIQGKTSDWATATVRSHHMERGKGYEEQNMGLGIEHSLFGNTRLALGFYRNSERRDSVYAAGVYCPVSVRWGNWRVCGLAGGVSGYSDDVAPLAGLVMAYESKEWGLNLILFPNGKGDFSNGLVAAQIKRRF